MNAAARRMKRDITVDERVFQRKNVTAWWINATKFR